MRSVSIVFIGILLISCAEVQSELSNVDKAIDDFKEENKITQKIDDISKAANEKLEKLKQ